MKLLCLGNLRLNLAWIKSIKRNVSEMHDQRERKRTDQVIPNSTINLVLYPVASTDLQKARLPPTQLRL